MKLSEARKEAEKYVKSRKFDKAIELYKKIVSALERRRGRAEPQDYNTLGDLYLKRNDKENAIINIKKAMEIYEEQGIDQQAAAMGKRILRIDSEDKEVIYKLAKIYHKRGVITEAISYYTEYINKLLVEGDKSGALEVYKEMFKNQPIPLPVSLEEYKKAIDLCISLNRMDDAKEYLAILYEKAEEMGREDILKYVQRMQGRLGVSIISESVEEKNEPVLEGSSGEEELEVVDDVNDLENIISEISGELEEEGVSEEIAEVIREKEITGTDSSSANMEYINSYLSMAEMSLEIDHIDQAVDYFMQAAGFYLKMENIPEAIKLLKRAVKVDPTNINVRKQLIQLYISANDREAVIEEYLGLADAYIKNGDTHQAEEVLNKALRISPDNKKILEKLESIRGGKTGDALIEDLISETKKEIEETITAQDIMKGKDEGGMKFTVEDSEDGEEALFTMDEIIEELKKGLQESISEDDVDTHYDMGLTFKEMGMIDEAIEEFKYALRSPKTELKAVGMLAQCYSDKGERERAYKMVIRGLKLPKYSDKDKVGLFYQLGTMYEEDGRYKEALMIYKKILKIDKNFHDVLKRAKRVFDVIKSGADKIKPNSSAQQRKIIQKSNDDDDDIDIGPISYV